MAYQLVCHRPVRELASGHRPAGGPGPAGDGHRGGDHARPGHGASFQLRVGAAPALASLRPVARAVGGGVARLLLSRPAHGRYLPLWFTRLPPGPAGTFQASVYEIELTGRA
jgi:hypothetical protein